MTRHPTARRAGAATPASSGSRDSARPGSPIPSATPPPRRRADRVRVELSHTFGFEAAHRLPRVPAEHKCARLHGHSWRVDVLVAGEVDPRTGWLLDFGEIQGFVEPLLAAEL